MLHRHSTARWVRGRLLLGGVAVALGTSAFLAPHAAQAAKSPAWVGSWAASPVAGASSSSCPAGEGEMNGRTVRNIVYPSVSGDRVRVRLSNVFGTGPLTVGGASVAAQKSGAATQRSTRQRLTFAGRKSVTIPAGAEVLSDWVDDTVVGQRTMAVSVYVASLEGTTTFHPVTIQDNFVSGAGDFTASPRATDYPTKISCWMIADGLDVHASAKVKGAVVAFGDSITDGNGSSKNANDRWPNYLARRLDARQGKTLSVVDEGISGNRLLSDAGTAGVSALARFDRDALGQAGVDDVIVMEGINDIGNSFNGNGPKVTFAELRAADRQLIAKAHAAGVKIYGATLTPYKGAGYWDQTGERVRTRLNNWIRNSGEFDGVVDFDAATANPDNPKVFDPRFDSGDHLHPNDAGYQAMAAAVNLAMLVQ